MKTITFEVRRSAPGKTNLADVNRFIEDHKGSKSLLVVEIDCTGIGEAFADHLESAGFTVKRVR